MRHGTRRVPIRSRVVGSLPSRYHFTRRRAMLRAQMRPITAASVT